MKRREMIRNAAFLSAVPVFFPDTLLTGNKETVTISEQQKVKRFGDERDWFFTRRYGMFVHWGIYSIPAWHEQHQWRARVPRAEYVKLADQWNPRRFNPEECLDIMEAAGMKYI